MKELLGSSGLMKGKFVYLESYVSRRIGVSTGINVIGPPKTCTFNCVYCEIGLTSSTNLVPPSMRSEDQFNPEQFQNEISAALIENPHLDSLTFGYYGEPTLSKYLREAVRIAKKVRDALNRSDRGPLFFKTRSISL